MKKTPKLWWTIWWKKITFGENTFLRFLENNLWWKKKNGRCFLSNNTWCGGTPQGFLSACFCSFHTKINFRLLKNLNTWWKFVAMMAMTAMMCLHTGKTSAYQKKMVSWWFSVKKKRKLLHGYIGFGLLECKSSISILCLPHLFCCSWAVAWLSMAKASSESFWIWGFQIRPSVTIGWNTKTFPNLVQVLGGKIGVKKQQEV